VSSHVQYSLSRLDRSGGFKCLRCSPWGHGHSGGSICSLAMTKIESSLLESIVPGHSAHDKKPKNRDLSKADHTVGWQRLASRLPQSRYHYGSAAHGFLPARAMTTTLPHQENAPFWPHFVIVSIVFNRSSWWCALSRLVE
jgi:hypothetical protein